MNLGYSWGDDRSNVAENRRRLASRGHFDASKLVIMKHVHGSHVHRIGESPPDPAEADGLVSDRAGAVLGALAADCVPALFADPHARVAGSCHAGWRGAMADIAANVVARMAELGAAPRNVRVALGPSIGPCCFEVGDEVIARFRSAFGELPNMVVDGPRKRHIDLRVVLRRSLERAGLRPEHIDSAAPCNKCEPSRFFSYRRDGKAGGCHLAFIGLTHE